MDGDGDYDVVASSWPDNWLSWFENPDWNENVINNNAPAAAGVWAADINKDDTMDVVVAHSGSNEVVWYQGPNWDMHVIGSSVITPSPPNYPDNVFVHDIDGDQDPDVLVTILNDGNFTIGSLILYTNNDTTWTKTVVDPDIGYILSLDFADMDFDGTLDVVAASPGHDLVLWYDLPSWTRGDTIDHDFNATGMGIGDIDKDDTVDVVVAGQDIPAPAPAVRWYKGPGWQMDTVYSQDAGFHSLVVTDLDNDTDSDIITTVVYLDQVWWFENKLIHGGLEKDRNSLAPFNFSLAQNYPNPFNPVTTIKFDLPKSSEVTLMIYNIIGEEVATLLSASLLSGSYQYDWDASNLASGVYLYRIQAGDYVETRKMILMR
jgi:hypothetical protein